MAGGSSVTSTSKQLESDPNYPITKQLESDPNYQLLAEEQQLRGHGHRDFGG